MKNQNPLPETLAPELRMAIATAARQDIEYLRRWYAKAVDFMTTRDPANVSEATAIFRRIFAPQAQISYTRGDAEEAKVIGPDAWATFTGAAVAKYNATQHLIGTQVVELESLVLNSDSSLRAGEARMTSYLQAWQAGDHLVRMVAGTYHDRLRFEPGIGWQISDMTISVTWRWDREVP